MEEGHFIAGEVETGVVAKLVKKPRTDGFPVATAPGAVQWDMQRSRSLLPTCR